MLTFKLSITKRTGELILFIVIIVVAISSALAHHVLRKQTKSAYYSGIANVTLLLFWYFASDPGRIHRYIKASAQQRLPESLPRQPRVQIAIHLCANHARDLHQLFAPSTFFCTHVIYLFLQSFKILHSASYPTWIAGPDGPLYYIMRGMDGWRERLSRVRENGYCAPRCVT